MSSVGPSGRLGPGSARFLEQYLDCFEKVEIAAALWRVSKPMPVADVEGLLGNALPPDELRRMIERLVQSRVLKRGEQDGTATIGLGVRARYPEFEIVMKAYMHDRIAVIDALSSIALQRIRSMAARRFARAFLLRRDDEDV